MPGVKNAGKIEFSGGTTLPPAEEKSIASARILPKGTTAAITGTVTAIFTAGGKNNVFVQDETAGIIVRGTGLESKVKAGDQIKASGPINDYFGMPQLEPASSDTVVVVKEGAGIPAPQAVSSQDINEQTEGELVTVTHAEVGMKDMNGNFSASDSKGKFVIKPADSFLLAEGKKYDSITGVVDYNFNEYKLIPRTAADVIEDSSAVLPVSANPAPGLVKAGTEVTLTSGTEGAVIHYTLDGTEPSEQSQEYTGPIKIEKDTVIKAAAMKSGFKSSEMSEFEYKIQKASVRIHDIQGETHHSPFNNQNVSDVEGIVTYVADSNNFYMQDMNPDKNDHTSEGVLVYKRAHGLQSGDSVKVSGQVKEWVLEGYSEKLQTDLPVTEINAAGITKVASGMPLPEPVVIGKDRKAPTQIIDNDQFGTFDPEEDGIDFYESLEGMRVAVENPKIIAPQNYGELNVVPGTVETNTVSGGLRATKDDFNPERLIIDINDNSFLAKTGDYFKGTVNGVLSYGFSNYKILSQRTELPEFVQGKTEREITAIKSKKDELTVASYNVENFSPADRDEKVTKLAQAIVNNLKSPDIVGLTEMQDNDGPADSGTTAADLSFKRLIDKIKALGGPEYSYTDIAPEDKKDGGQPGGNIRVGFLYNEKRVKLAPGTKGTATQAVGYEKGKLTLNPGRIDPGNKAFESSRKPLAAQFKFRGENVIVIANHFNSKGGDEPLFGKNQPPQLKSEIQRHQIAGIINSFVKDVKKKDPQANMIVLGDFNDFEFSKTFDILKGSELANMVDKIKPEERYSYTYQGNSQVLDHILVSRHLAETTKADIVHINSSFMEEQGRASDHDPLLIQVDFSSRQRICSILDQIPYTNKEQFDKLCTR
ncbi:endonuclease [Bacillus sp. FJAT-42376]|nr:endonuclease [Bacillus sp. FJAT-42376]